VEISYPDLCTERIYLGASRKVQSHRVKKKYIQPGLDFLTTGFCLIMKQFIIWRPFKNSWIKHGGQQVTRIAIGSNDVHDRALCINFKKQMIRKLFILFIIVFAAFACSKPPVKKPQNLLRQEKMIDILVDVHLAESSFNNRRHRDTLVERSSSADFYYSVLQKHEVQDSVFEKSLVFYASQPRQFERMYRQVMNQLTEIEQEFSGRKSDMQELELQRRTQ
jgi:hypothetical protein